MRIITTHEHDLITSVIGEGLTDLPEAVLEKDLLITEALRTVATPDEDGPQLIFCGGTCLSKAYGLIDRMSEDIDFKLVLPTGLSSNTRRRLLSQIKKRLIQVFTDADFSVPVEGVKARDGNHYIQLDLQYRSRFPVVASLRPAIKVEINARPPILPTTTQAIASMLDRLIQTSSPALQLKCISVEETLAEKVLSFLRRTAEAQAGRNRAEYDSRLVRHIYDVHAIVQRHRDMSLPHACFAALVVSDAAQFQNQYPEFAADPVGQMQTTLDALRDDSGLFEHDYLRFVDELVFGKPVTFAEARMAFVSMADRLIEQMRK